MEPLNHKSIEKKDIQEKPKKPYSTPKLFVYGTVEKITGKGSIPAKFEPWGSRT